MRKGLLCLLAAVALSTAVFGCTKTQTKATEPADTTIQAPEKIVVNIAIDGSKGEEKAINAKGQLELTSDATAYDALIQLCDNEGYGITGDSSYVKTIGGLGEGSFGVLPCGWMYSVDGNYPPKPAGEYILKDKNEVIWEFVK